MDEMPAMRVYADMCADLFHYGHGEFLKQCKHLYPNAYLMVGIHNDADIASYKRVPIMTMQERIRSVENCKWVDQVIANAPLRLTEEYLNQYDIHIVVHDDSIDEVTRQEWYHLPIVRGIYQEVPRTNGISTTNIIERVLERGLDSQN